MFDLVRAVFARWSGWNWTGTSNSGTLLQPVLGTIAGEALVGLAERESWDNAPAHRGEAFERDCYLLRLCSRWDWCRLMNLPGYSPECSTLDEAIWGWYESSLATGNLLTWEVDAE